MKARSAQRSALAFLAALFLSATANAQIFRSYLALNGNDANPCTLPQPCRLLPAALNAVANGGEIWMLDSANYNTATVNVTKSVTILAVPGVVGSVVATGGPAINIATGGVKVGLRNLVIVPLPGAGATHGVVMSAGSALTFEQCLVANIPERGVWVTADATVQIFDSTLRDNGTAGLWQEAGRLVMSRSRVTGSTYGVFLYNLTASSTIEGDLSEVTLSGNNYGMFAASVASPSAVVKGSLRDSQVVRNFAANALIESDVSSAVTVSLSGNTFSNGAGHGVWVYGTGAKAWAAGNTISDNVVGVNITNGGTFESAGTNAVRNNGTDVSGTITVPVPALR